jgi:hypothetical protein
MMLGRNSGRNGVTCITAIQQPRFRVAASERERCAVKWTAISRTLDERAAIVARKRPMRHSPSGPHPALEQADESLFPIWRIANAQTWDDGPARRSCTAGSLQPGQ